MLELLFTVCVTVSPYYCKEEKMVFAEQGLSVYACGMGAQKRLAEWTNKHPHWTVHRYRCDRVGRFARI